MAGEWIPVDCNLATKPEVLEVAAATHEPIEVVVGRMVRLWSWAWHVTADGTIRVPLAMLGMVAGRARTKAGTTATRSSPGWSSLTQICTPCGLGSTSAPEKRASQNATAFPGTWAGRRRETCKRAAGAWMVRMGNCCGEEE